jgi:tetratricopeptide (TPR) repeat protein
MDVQGRDKARPFIEKANATFTTVVDEENLLGQLYGFKAIPNGFLIDEQGLVRYKKLGGFDIRRTETSRIVEDWAASSGQLETAEVSNPGLSSEHSRANAHFRKGWELYRQGKVKDALAEWRKGVELEPDNWIIRKQIWAVENPDRFYAPSVDYDWQKEQIARGL